VDLRRHSATFGRTETFLLSDVNKHMLWIPAGFGHGFRVVSETAHVTYKSTGFYSFADERTIAWDDPDLKIDWQLERSAHPLAKRQTRRALPRCGSLRVEMRILVFGASGMLGKDLLAAFSEDDVTGLSSQDADLRDVGSVLSKTQQAAA